MKKLNPPKQTICINHVLDSTLTHVYKKKNNNNQKINIH